MILILMTILEAGVVCRVTIDTCTGGADGMARGRTGEATIRIAIFSRVSMACLTVTLLKRRMPGVLLLLGRVPFVVALYTCLPHNLGVRDEDSEQEHARLDSKSVCTDILTSRVHFSLTVWREVGDMSH